MRYPESIEHLINELCRLPGVGQKTAHRFAEFILKLPREEARELARAIADVKEKIRECRGCYGFSEEEYCPICSNPRRETETLCVVADPSDVGVMERAPIFRGRYLVLGGTLSPLEGRTPDKLRFNELVEKVRRNNVREVIVALNPDVEGETTGQYIANILKEFPVKVTRLAYGIPVGGDIDFADEVTLTRALEGRRNI